MATDLYKELGLARGANDEEIRKAYRKLAAQYHPDRNQGDAAAEERFKRINHAYQVLSDPKKRSLYDRFGETGLREGFNPSAGFSGRSPFGGGGFEDLFGGGRGIGDLFADVLRGGGGARGRDATGTVEVDFANAVLGTTVQVQVSGVAGPVTVRVPPGAGDGDKLRVPGKGSPGRGGAGDLILTVKVLEHQYFRRKGLDLELDFPITAAEAFSGAKVRVPTLEGHVSLTVPAGAQSGQMLRLRGRGVSRKNERGDLLVRLSIRLPRPEQLGEAERQTLARAAQMLADLTDVAARDDIKL